AWMRAPSPSSQQTRVPPGRGGVDRRHPLGGEADDVVRPAGLGSGPRQPLPAERLAADNRADLVAVDVEVPRPRPALDEAARGIDAAVQAEGEAVASAGDVVDHVLVLVGAEARDVEHRAEVLPLQVGDRVALDDRRRAESAVGAGRAELALPALAT